MLCLTEANDYQRILTGIHEKKKKRARGCHISSHYSAANNELHDAKDAKNVLERSLQNKTSTRSAPKKKKVELVLTNKGKH